MKVEQERERERKRKKEGGSERFSTPPHILCHTGIPYAATINASDGGPRFPSIRQEWNTVQLFIHKRNTRTHPSEIVFVVWWW